MHHVANNNTLLLFSLTLIKNVDLKFSKTKKEIKGNFITIYTTVHLMSFLYFTPRLNEYSRVFVFVLFYNDLIKRTIEAEDFFDLLLINQS